MSPKLILTGSRRLILVVVLTVLFVVGMVLSGVWHVLVSLWGNLRMLIVWISTWFRRPMT